MASAGGGSGGAALGRAGSAAIGSGYGGDGRRLGDLGSAARHPLLTAADNDDDKATLPPPQHRGGGAARPPRADPVPPTISEVDNVWAVTSNPTLERFSGSWEPIQSDMAKVVPTMAAAVVVVSGRIKDMMVLLRLTAAVECP
ncbi:Os08g0265350 [Oryza sativa Japonica Group]|uniref:Os08g0265350 protein n=1 Tax=Oryza sativa subsp. japonica TaxID=39947 RepID=C7J622_ORYSJ|nr:Os08g0265350 [Oryza sativa Japonica Group]|eukprot:NP_001175484.1 Os08g0265350 [Oryza sativa Japonica Group]